MAQITVSDEADTGLAVNAFVGYCVFTVVFAGLSWYVYKHWTGDHRTAAVTICCGLTALFSWKVVKWFNRL